MLSEKEIRQMLDNAEIDARAQFKKDPFSARMVTIISQVCTLKKVLEIKIE